MKEQKSFTVIELLVVISVIGLLASIIWVGLKGATEKGKFAKVQVQLDQFVKASFRAKIENNKTLIQVTGSGCSDCVCRGRDIREVPDSDSCVQNWYNALSKIQDAVGGGLIIEPLKRDPWNSPYGLDENELESGPTDCRKDTIRTAGPDGMLYNGDDYALEIPHVTCH